MDSDIIITATGKAYDTGYQSMRPIFSSEISYQKINESVVGTRVWSGVTGEAVAKEMLVWSERDGLLRASMCQHYLREEGELERDGNKVQFMLSSHKTQYNQRTCNMRINKLLVTLLSMPLEIVRNWEQLKAGESFDRSYAVLKAQNHTGVRFKMDDDNHQSIVCVTPLNPVFRFIFGSLKFVFEPGRPLLKEIFGLIEPRDHKVNGKYKEHIAFFRFDTPLDPGQVIIPITTKYKVN